MSTETNKEKDKELEAFEAYLSDDHEACLKEIEEKIIEVVRDNPNITAQAVYEREQLRRIRKGASTCIRKAFTQVLGTMLGSSEHIRANGSRKESEGNRVQLIYVQGKLF